MIKPWLSALLFILSCSVLAFFMLGWFMPFTKFKVTFRTTADSSSVVTFLMNPGNHLLWSKNVYEVSSILTTDAFNLTVGDDRRQLEVRRLVNVDSSLKYVISDEWQSGTVEFQVRRENGGSSVTFYHDTRGNDFLKKCLLAWCSIWTVEDWKSDLDRLKTILDRRSIAE